MENLSLSINLVNAMLAYLGKQPYQEVFQLIEAIQKEAQAKPEDEVTQ
jgi:hypothetical protein